MNNDHSEQRIEWIIIVKKVTEEEEDLLFDWSFEIKGRKFVDFELSPPIFVVFATGEEVESLKKEFDWIDNIIEKSKFKKELGLNFDIKYNIEDT